MDTFVSLADLSEARKMQRAIMLLLGLPKRGIHVGGGRHVSFGVPSDARRIKGYTTRHVDFVKHPSGDGRYAVRVTLAMRAAWQAHKDRLTQAQRDWLRDRLLTEAELSDDWKESGDRINESHEIQP